MRPSPLRPVWLCLLGVALWLPLVACKDTAREAVAERGRPVRVKLAAEESRPVRLEYVGTTMSESIKRYGFKVAGKVAQVWVKEGQAITSGQQLARIDAVDYNAAARNSQLNVRQAQQAKEEAERTLRRVEALYADGARTLHDLEQARLGFEVRSAVAEQARLKVGADRRTVNDTTLRSEVDGFVVDVMAKRGELVGPGQPVVIVRGKSQVIHVGVSQQDVKRLSEGVTAQVEVDGKQARGRVSRIEPLPDTSSRTWTVEVSLDEPLAEQDFWIGSVARVGFEMGEHAGHWVPVTAVLTEGVSFVFVEDEGRALRRNVELGEVSGSEVEVRGLVEGDKVIVEGMKNLEDGYLLEVVP